MKAVPCIFYFLLSISSFGQETSKNPPVESKILFQGSFPLSVSTFDRIVFGKVTQKANGEPISYASVTVTNSSKTTNTDFDGEFSLHAMSNDTLVFRYIGYKTQQIRVDKNEINIQMEEDVPLDCVLPYEPFHRHELRKLGPTKKATGRIRCKK